MKPLGEDKDAIKVFNEALHCKTKLTTSVVRSKYNFNRKIIKKQQESSLDF